MAHHRIRTRSTLARYASVLMVTVFAAAGALAATGAAQAVPVRQTAAAAPFPATLTAGQRLTAGKWLASPDKFVTLRMQSDGNLTLVAGGHVLWYSKTPGPGHYLRMDSAGNVGVFNGANQQLWATHTSGAGNVWRVQDVGNVTVRSAANKIIWSLNSRAVELDGGNALYQNQYLTGRGVETLGMQGDGNLVLRRGSTPIWDSHTDHHPGAFLQLQNDGSLVIYASDHRVLWHIGGAGAAARLSVGPDGNLSLRNAKGGLIWQSFTPKTPTAALYAGQLVSMWGGKVTGLPGAYSDLLATSKNQAVDNSSSCGNSVHIDIRLMKFLVQVTGKYKIKINNIVTGHGCDGAQHPKGRAADIATVTDLTSGATTSFGGISGGNNYALNAVFVNFAASILPNGAGLGQRDCAGESSAHPRAGVQFFADVCNHQHVQVASG